jgi:hypothetical protein
MKTTLLYLAILSIVVSSCSTAYQTGQTPDDVYYSPTKVTEEYVRVNKKETKTRYNQYDEDYYDDRYLRMKVHNRSRWNNLNDWYAYEKWNLGYYSYYNPYFYNPYLAWNNYYNPYFYSPYTFNPYYHNNFSSYYNYGIQPRNITYQAPRRYNLNTYGNVYNGGSNGNNTNVNLPRNNSNSGNRGSTLRDIFSGITNNAGNGNSGNNGSGNTGGSSSNISSNSSTPTNAPIRKF